MRLIVTIMAVLICTGCTDGHVEVFQDGVARERLTVPRRFCYDKADIVSSDSNTVITL